MEVERTILPAFDLAGAMAWSWASRDRCPCRGTHSKVCPHGVSEIARRQLTISLWPGRKTNTVSPSSRCSSHRSSKPRSTCLARLSLSLGTW